ncbi:MAG: hypothetical protein RR814_08335, partial [Oscillospiraceae bacterium]
EHLGAIPILQTATPTFDKEPFFIAINPKGQVRRFCEAKIQSSGLYQAPCIAVFRLCHYACLCPLVSQLVGRISIFCD